jgi:hypothetical protein
MTSGPYGDGTGPLDPYGAPGPGTPPAYPPQGYSAPGYPQQAYPGYNPQQGVYPAPGVTPMAYGAYPRPRNGLGTAALVLGIIGVVFCWVPFTGWALNILAIIFGAIGRKRAIDRRATNKSSAVAGLVLGVAGLAVWIIIIVVALAAVSTVGTISYS